MLPAPTLEIIETAKVIDVQSPQRKIDFQHVAHLADSLTDISQMHPIIVKRQSNSSQYLLHDGAHCLLAALQKGTAIIRALVFSDATPDDHIRRCILERDLLSREDSWAMKCLKLQELKSLYESYYPVTRVGRGRCRKTRNIQQVPAFAEHIARESRNKKSTIAEMLTLAKKLGPTLLHALDQHGLSKEVGKHLRKLPTEAERFAVIDKILEMKRSAKHERKQKITVAAARYEIKEEARKSASAAVVLTSEDARVIHSKMEDCDAVKPHSIDAVITDPLYHGKHLHLYGKAAELSARVLKPGGFAAFYCGRLYVNEVMGLVGKHLKFRSLITLHHKQHFGNVGKTKLSTDCKYILVYQNEGADLDFYTSLKGVIVGNGQEKGSHEFQQSVSDLDNLIEAITQPGEVILDMFAGSGTTGVAAILKSRKAVLIEDDEVDCNACRARLNDALVLRAQQGSVANDSDLREAI